jgi:hypothetical protein
MIAGDSGESRGHGDALVAAAGALLRQIVGAYWGQVGIGIKWAARS